ncbi:MAG: hypothetical protein GY870_05085 [archaeon]|nr:hypothetical protein [archaeon]
MSDNAVSSGILQTSSLIITIIIISSSFAVAYGVSAGIQSSGDNFSRQLKMDFEVIGTGDLDSTDNSFIVYLKNYGTQDIDSGNFGIIDIFLDGVYIEYNSSDSTDYRWTALLLSDFNSDTDWSSQETISFNITLPTGDQLGSGSHEIRVSIYGNNEKYTFSV